MHKAPYFTVSEQTALHSAHSCQNVLVK